VKKINSGGTNRTTSKQAQPTKAKQAKAAQRASGTSDGSGAKRGKAASAKGRSSTKKGDGLITRIVKSVGKALAGGPPDALELLKMDHRKVDRLFSKVKANEDGNNASTFKKIKAELEVHAHIEEKVLYPYILARGDQELNRIVREGLEEHKQIKMFLEELTGLAGTTETFRARIKVLMEDVEHHVKEEEDEMFPLVRDQIDNSKLQKLGERLQKEKTKVIEKSAPLKKASSTKHRTAPA
jgi:iron-sulfur cluster repair protein YtfE (RIC family)